VRRSFWVAIMTAVLMALAGCSDDDCPTCPPTATENPPYDGRLYATSILGTRAIFVIDTQTDSVRDSVVLCNTFHDLALSESGSMLAATEYMECHLLDAKSFQELDYIPDFVAANFCSHDKYILGYTLDGYSLYDVSARSIVWSRDLGRWASPYYDSKTNSFYYLTRPDTLHRFQIDSTIVTNEWVITSGNGYKGLVRDFDISADCRRAYFLASGSVFFAFLVIDLDADSLLCEFALYSSFGDVRVHPNGTEVWVTDPGTGGLEPPYPGTIYIFDAQTGEYLRGISLYGYVPWPQIGLDAWRLEFTPDGSHAYVLTGNYLDPPTGNILRIDTRSYRVENLIFPEFDHYLFSLAVGPKP
jgi:hypothetical protein